MATPGISTQAKLAWLRSMEADDFYIALYARDAKIDPHTETYVTAGEVTGSGYTPGGVPLEGIVFGVTGSTAWMTWTKHPRWENSSIRAAYAMIYNRSKGDLAIAVLTFGGEIVSTNGPWTLEFPEPGATAVIRWA